MLVTHVMRLGISAILKVARPRIGLLGEAEHRFYRAGESDRPSWGGSAGTSHLGHSEACSTTLSTDNHKFAPSLTVNTRRATLGLGGDANARSQARLSNRTDGRRSRTASPTRPRSQIASSPGRACADHFASV